jgi:hypothetical protein
MCGRGSMQPADGSSTPLGRRPDTSLRTRQHEPLREHEVSSIVSLSGGVHELTVRGKQNYRDYHGLP